MASRRARRLASCATALAPPAVTALFWSRLGQVDSRTGCADRQNQCPTFSIGCYNVLCSTYAVKWRELQGVGPDGKSNWAQRWPVMRDIIAQAHWDIVCLQEVELTDTQDIVDGLGHDFHAHYFKHAKRPPDGVLIAVRDSAFQEMGVSEVQNKGAVAFGRVDLVHKQSGCKVRVVNAHCRGGDKAQLSALAQFADETSSADLTLVAGDFNEDFRGGSGVQGPFIDAGYTTLIRERMLPQLSRPPNKQEQDQKSGKGKVDWIFVKGAGNSYSHALFRDEASWWAILASHAACAATGEWPSDHGAEGISVRLRPAKGIM